MKYKVIRTSFGGTEYDVMNGLTYEEAREFCESMNWEIDLGYIWDLEIEEDEEF